jgi:DNA-binding NarL/FixJ family response regulator
MCYTFLVVDDTSFMRKMATECLKQHGYDVIGEAINGKEAVQKYKELKPEVVMMDLTMPEMNGIDAIKEILSFDSEAVILVCSASNQKDMIQEALDAGAVGYLMKPFKPDYMNEIIKRYAEPHLDPPVADEETGEDVELEESDLEMEVNTEDPEEDHVPDMSVDEVAATVEPQSIEAKDEHESVIPDPPMEQSAPVADSSLEQKRPSTPVADSSIEQKRPSTPLDDSSIEQKRASTPLADSSIEQKRPSTPLADSSIEQKRPSTPLDDKKIKFVTSFMCNWEEKVQGENKAYSFTYTENDNKISIEMMDESKEKQSIQLTLDGFRELHDWLEQRLEEGKRMN